MMEQVGITVDSAASSTASVNADAAAAQSPAQSRRWSIEHCIQSLMHACQCRNASCDMAMCQKMKQVMAHTRRCRRKTNGGCPVCKQLIALCCYHSKHCRQAKCRMPFCAFIQYKLRQQRIADAQKMQPKVDIMCHRIDRFTCYQWQIHMVHMPTCHKHLLKWWCDSLVY